MAKKKFTIDIPEKVKILGISGSPKKANTHTMVQFTLKAAESTGYVETEYISLADHHFSHCIDCMKCKAGNKPVGDPPMCYEDPLSESPWLFDKMREADALLIGFPVYSGHIPGLMAMAMEVHPGIYGFGGLGGAMTVETNKPRAIISQGGNVYSSQEIGYWHEVQGGTPLLSAAWPTVEDPEPQASFTGGILTCQDGLAVYRKDAWTSAGSRINPPLTGIQNERTLRNLGRWLAVAAMMMKLGQLAWKEAEFQVPPSARRGRSTIAAKPGSALDKERKEGKAIFVTEEELKERMKIRA